MLGTAAYLLRWAPGQASNYGELIPPTPVPALSDLRGKWVLVTFDPGACDARCEEKLYYLRQVRRAQERTWIASSASGCLPTGKAARGDSARHQGTRFAAFPPDGFPGNVREHIYVVDPLGNLMLRFPRDPDPSGMVKDLQRLLKYSPRPR